ncbi:MAG: hypothetical protein RL208_401 [Pseudomonadota bacterium]|jgi:hypothetical protein
MKKILLSFVATLTTKQALATCPVCVAAAGAGLGIGRKLGVSDAIIAIWLASSLTLSSIWLGNWIIKKYKLFPVGRLIHLFTFTIHALVIYFMYKKEYIIYNMNLLFGIDDFIAGSIIGCIVTYIQSRLYIFLKKKNNNKPHFPYEKVVILIATLVLTTTIIHVINK